MMLWMAHGEQGLYTSSGDAAPSGELFEFECKQENWEYTPVRFASSLHRPRPFIVLVAPFSPPLRQ